MNPRPCSTMTDAELATELQQLGDKWDEFRANMDEGYGGSPGEWMVERMGEIEHEQHKRTGRENARKLCKLNGWVDGTVLRSKRWQTERKIRRIEKQGVWLWYRDKRGDHVQTFLRTLPADTSAA